MIPFYQVVDNDDTWEDLSQEARLAREMGSSPFEVSYVQGDSLVMELIQHVSPYENIGFIFDPEFWYSDFCWDKWVSAVHQNGTGGYINVPLGNQEPGWCEDLASPAYVTLSGLEKTETLSGENTWHIRKGKEPQCYCLSIVPISVLRAVPDSLRVHELPLYWAKRETKVRIYCHCWLHSFNALKSAEYRADLLEMCDWKDKSVLELGCKSGLMSRYAKDHYGVAYWLGIDLDEKALSQAKENVDLAIKADGEISLPVLHQKKFDRIVCADFLEHLAYPWQILKGLQKYINKKGLLIASFPNVGHWSIVQDLIKGRFDEAPSGILCVSHLRFGTKISWNNWFEKSGWEIIDWKQEKLPLPDFWEEFIKSLGQSADRQSLETIRYRVVARPCYE